MQEWSCAPGAPPSSFALELSYHNGLLSPYVLMVLACFLSFFPNSFLSSLHPFFPCSFLFIPFFRPSHCLSYLSYLLFNFRLPFLPFYYSFFFPRFIYFLPAKRLVLSQDRINKTIFPSIPSLFLLFLLNTIFSLSFLSSRYPEFLNQSYCSWSSSEWICNLLLSPSLSLSLFLSLSLS